MNPYSLKSCIWKFPNLSKSIRLTKFLIQFSDLFDMSQKLEILFIGRNGVWSLYCNLEKFVWGHVLDENMKSLSREESWNSNDFAFSNQWSNMASTSLSGAYEISRKLYTTIFFSG